MLKRFVDVVGAALLLVVSAPLLALIAILVRRDSPGPVLFRQTRLGMGMHPFAVLKFRTMRTDASESTHREYVRKIMTSDAIPDAGSCLVGPAWSVGR